MDQPQVLSEEAQHLISLLQNQATVEAEKVGEGEECWFPYNHCFC